MSHLLTTKWDSVIAQYIPFIELRDNSHSCYTLSYDPLLILINATLTFVFSAGVISNWTNETRIPPCTISQAFQYFLDITTPPSPVLLQQFAALATNDKQKKKLEILSKVNSLSLQRYH